MIRSDGSGEHVFARSDYIIGDPIWSPDGTKLAFWELSHQQPLHDGLWVEPFGPGLDAAAPRIGAGMFTNYPAWSPDGRSIAFTAKTPDGYGVFVADSSGACSPVEIARGSDWAPSWSPDGTKIAVWADHQILVMNSDGSDLHQVTHSGTSVDIGPSWSPDGRSIMYTSWGHIYRMSPSGETVVQLTKSSFDYTRASWSPDGSRILAEGRPLGTDPSSTELYILHADGSDPVQITHLGGIAGNPLAALGDGADGLHASWQPIPAAGEPATPAPTPPSQCPSASPHVA